MNRYTYRVEVAGEIVARFMWLADALVSAEAIAPSVPNKVVAVFERGNECAIARVGKVGGVVISL